MSPEARGHLMAYALGYLRDLSTREVLITSADILIVYYVIYRVLKLIRGTRAAQMLVGMMLVAAVFAAAKRFELTTVSWLFENLINYFIIFLIVIFQHDIRRGLMQVGRNLWRSQQYEETYVIEEVVQAADELSRRRIGGLIVMERDADLADHLGEVGIQLDAKVTKELLVTLFIPDADNHMHDGAVIVKNLRIQQAGAVLPLSANAKLDKQLGTRHRAAIGVTEETDAVVVVVSEERGTVSLCFNGNIARDLAPATLRKALLGLFQKKNKTKPKGQGQGPGKKGRRRGDAEAETEAARRDEPSLPPPLLQPPGAGAVEAGSSPERHDPTPPAPIVSRERVSPELLSLVVTQPMQRPAGLPLPSASSQPGPAPSSASGPAGAEPPAGVEAGAEADAPRGPAPEAAPSSLSGRLSGPHPLGAMQVTTPTAAHGPAAPPASGESGSGSTARRPTPAGVRSGAASE